MVRRVEWTREARTSFDDAIDWLAERNPGAAARLQSGIESWTELTARRLLGTPHAWPGCKTAIYRDGYRRIVFRPYDDRIEIIAFRDTRQDNSAFDFKPRGTRT